MPDLVLLRVGQADIDYAMHEHHSASKNIGARQLF
jgi:hypothetical protein